MRIFLAYLLTISSLLAHADPPPVSLQGVTGAKMLPKWNLQVPYNQATNKGGISALIETGNDNLLRNPSFEDTSLIAGWTCPTFTCSISSAYSADGATAVAVNVVGSAGTIIQQTLNPYPALGGRNLEASMYVSAATNTAANSYQLCALVNGAEINCTAVPQTSAFAKVTVYFTAATGLPIGLRLKSLNSTTTSVYFDGAYLGAARGLGVSSPDTAWSTYTPTTQGIGTPTLVECHYERQGTNGNILCGMTTGTVSATQMQVGLPSGWVIDTNFANGTNTGVLQVGTGNYNNSSGTTYAMSVLASSGLTYLKFSNNSTNAAVAQNGSALLQSNQYWHFSASVPLSGAIPQTAISIQNSDYPPTPWTPTFTGGGTVTGINCTHQRKGRELIGDCTFTVGTVTATTFSFTLPNSLVTDSTIPSISIRGTGTTSGNGVGIHHVLATPNSNLINMGFKDTSNSTGLTADTGTVLFGNNVTVSINFRVPINGWSESVAAPQLVGSIVSPGSGVVERFSGTYGGASAIGGCTSSPCTLYSQTSGVSGLTVTRSATGTYAANISSGICSTALVCTGNAAVGGGGTLFWQPLYSAAATTTQYQFQTNTTSSGAADSFGSFSCECNH